MVRIIDTFLPLCHGFLGKVFVQIPWLDIVEEQRPSENLVQAVLRLIVKLAAEPQVRQVSGSKHDHLLRKCTKVQEKDVLTARSTAWFDHRTKRVDALVADRGQQIRDSDAGAIVVNVVFCRLPCWLNDKSFQWYVMSVDCKVIVPLKERHPLDAAVLR